MVKRTRSRRFRVPSSGVARGILRAGPPHREIRTAGGSSVAETEVNEIRVAFSDFLRRIGLLPRRDDPLEPGGRGARTAQRQPGEATVIMGSPVAAHEPAAGAFPGSGAAARRVRVGRSHATACRAPRRTVRGPSAAAGGCQHRQPRTVPQAEPRPAPAQPAAGGGVDALAATRVIGAAGEEPLGQVVGVLVAVEGELEGTIWPRRQRQQPARASSRMRGLPSQRVDLTPSREDRVRARDLHDRGIERQADHRQLRADRRKRASRRRLHHARKDHLAVPLDLMTMGKSSLDLAAGLRNARLHVPPSSRSRSSRLSTFAAWSRSIWTTSIPASAVSGSSISTSEPSPSTGSPSRTCGWWTWRFERISAGCPRTTS